MDAYDAVADPTRRAVLDLLAERARPAGEIVAAFPHLTQPAVSRHLRVLRDAGLVDVTAQAQHRVYALRRGALDEVAAWAAKVASDPQATDTRKR